MYLLEAAVVAPQTPSAEDQDRDDDQRREVRGSLPGVCATPQSLRVGTAPAPTPTPSRVSPEATRRNRKSAPAASTPGTKPPAPFRCPVCGKGYQHDQSLLRHRKTECGSKPLPYHYCPRCSFRSIYRNSMAKHMRSQHGECEQTLSAL